MNKIFLFVLLLVSIVNISMGQGVPDSKSTSQGRPERIRKNRDLTPEQKEKLKKQREEEKKRQEQLKEQNAVTPEKDELIIKCFTEYSKKHDEIKKNYKDKIKHSGDKHNDHIKDIKEYWDNIRKAGNELRECKKNIYPTNRKHVKKFLEEQGDLKHLAALA